MYERGEVRVGRAVHALAWHEGDPVGEFEKNPRVVLDFLPEHSGWATDSQVYHRESKFARVVEDSNLLSKCAKCAAFSQDNCDSEPGVGVRQGAGPHIPCVACMALWAGVEVGMLDDASALKRIGDLSLDDILAGSDAAEGERRYGAFFATLLGAVSKSERMRSAEGGALWCCEAQLRAQGGEISSTSTLICFCYFPLQPVVFFSSGLIPP